jgi:hypothetical protein
VSKQRHNNDAYYTHAGLVKTLLDNVPICGDVCEPCAGEGHIAYQLLNVPLDVVSADIDPNAGYAMYEGEDMTSPDTWKKILWDLDKTGFDWTVTNPPYRQPDCQKIIENAWEHSKIGVAMLLRLTYLEPCALSAKDGANWLARYPDRPLGDAFDGRAPFLKSAPLSHLLVFNPRPQFRTDTKGTDNTTVAWFVWQKEWADNTQIKFITDWKTNV